KEGDRNLLDHFYKSGLLYWGNWEGDINWDEVGKFDDAEEFYSRYATHQYGCHGCPIKHSDIFEVPGIGTVAIKCAAWPSLAGPVWNTDRKVMAHACYLCNKYGLDNISTGNAISFLMELYHKGVITEKDTDGIAMKRGDEKAIISAIHKIGKQEGFGKLLRDGVLEAAKTIGKGVEDCVMQIKGQEMYFHEVRPFRSHALGAAVATRDEIEDHTTICQFWMDYDREGMEKWAEEFYGSKEAAIPDSYEKKPLMVWDTGNRKCAIDMLGACRYLTPEMVTPSLKPWAKLFSLATGRDTTEDELLFAAQRTKVLERAFNVLKGIRKKDDTLPKRIFETPVSGGPFKGDKLDKKKFDKMIDEYYQLRDWDEDGVPKDETFKKFGLSSEWKVFKKRLGKKAVSHG
ncbi:aldehyde ferredoxin oxidoreductase C-terminal domain-containing protein, partial [Chloroflexota bacterium]